MGQLTRGALSSSCTLLFISLYPTLPYYPLMTHTHTRTHRYTHKCTLWIPHCTGTLSYLLLYCGCGPEEIIEATYSTVVEHKKQEKKMVTSLFGEGFLFQAFIFTHRDAAMVLSYSRPYISLPIVPMFCVGCGKLPGLIHYSLCHRQQGAGPLLCMTDWNEAAEP